LLKGELLAGQVPVTHGGIVGQVWRDGARQATLARFLRAVAVAPIDESLGRHAGALLAQTSGHDVIDAALIMLAADGDLILTSDPDDLTALSAARGAHVEIVSV
jgi:hypothetical protein